MNGSQMALTCCDCGQESAYVRVGIYVDPQDTSVENLSTQVDDIVGATAEDFDDELPVVCAECECEVPYRLAFAATVRKQAHKGAEEAAMAYNYLENVIRSQITLECSTVGEFVAEFIKKHRRMLQLELDANPNQAFADTYEIEFDRSADFGIKPVPIDQTGS